MQAKPVIAIVCVCAAAGVVTYDVGFLTNHGKSPAVAPRSGAPDGGTAASASPFSDPTATGSPVGDGGAGDRSGAAAATAGSGDDFNKLFERLVAQHEEKAANPNVDDASLDAAMRAVQGPIGGSGSDAWDRLEVRGILVGNDRSLALVNGKLLRVGDELPGVRYRIERILADRIVALPFAGGVPRALTLHTFESPSRRTGNVDLNALKNAAPATSAAPNPSPPSPTSANGSPSNTTGGSPSGSTAAPSTTKGDKQ